ncbi:MAG: hypothetical protein HY821_02820 [Acidobacteria bacterium]|nr:hypothetical protein [Acidobacteriota bacterium]
MNLKTLSPPVAALLACTFLAAAQQAPSPSENKEANLKAYVDLLRKDVKKEKVGIFTELMDLTPDEAAKFWPVYNSYDKALTVLADERIALIKLYADSYGNLTPAIATKLAMGVLDLDARRTQLKRQYVQKFSQALNPILAARFLQIENQVEKILDLQIASSLPVIE